jgi:VWFA-related protein
VIEAAKRSSAVVYAVTTASAARVPSLEELAKVTGGDMLRVTSSADLREALQKILQDFRSRYVLAFTPTGVAAGGFHRVDVKVKGKGVDVKARPGYIGMDTPK